MFENLVNLVRQNAGDAIITNPTIPNEKNEAAVETAGSSIMSTLKNALDKGRVSDVLAFFKNGKQGSPELVEQATNNYAQDLQNNIGIAPAEARKTAAAVVPQTMQQLATKTADPSDKSFNIQDIFNKLSGNKTSGFNMQEMLNKFSGGKLDKDGDGDVDFNDLKSIFAGGGGIVDKVKGMFK
ncbi:MAG TPA: hypothetical protein VFP97_07760 [Chitinophagaceae bacterium]|nr:hypothetical protein [Chitinophagaceae bacterium]